MRPGVFPAWTRVLILWGLVLPAAYGLTALEAWQKGMESPGRPSSYSTGSRGYKALYLWVQALGIPLKRWERPFRDLPPDVSTLIVLQPEFGPDPGELRALDDWLRRGGTLLLSSVPAGPFLSHFGIQGRLVAPKPGEEGKARKTLGQPGPYTNREYAVVRRSPQVLGTSRPEVVFHAGDTLGGLIAVVKAGKGRVIALADPLLISNQSLMEADHARMLLDLLASHLGDGSLAIDEYHHGYGRATTVLGHMAQSRTFPPLLQGVVLLLVLWAARGRRFGAARPLRQQEARSSMEYVKAMARLFRNSEKREFALEATTRWIEEEARRYLLDGDPALRKALESARRRLAGELMTDGELLRYTQGLYGSLEKAKRSG